MPIPSGGSITALVAVLSVLVFGAPAFRRVRPSRPFKDAIPPTAGRRPRLVPGRPPWQGDFGDPDILRVGNTYYAYSAGAGGRYLSVLTSTDLTDTGRSTRNWNPLPPEIANDPPRIRRRSTRSNNNDALVRPASWALPIHTPATRG